MASSAYAPLRVPVNFWQRDEVCTALGERDIGYLFRLLRRYCGASQTRIGAAVGYSQSKVSSIMNGNHAVAAITVLERIADGLDMPDHGRIRLGLAPKGEDPVKRRTTLGVGLAITLTPVTITKVLRQSAAEALEFTRERAASSVGKGTLDHLRAVIIELDQAYEWEPAAELFPVARAYRHRIAQLINGQHTLREARELYVQAAHFSYLLSDLAHDLGSGVTAEAWAIDSYQHANEAEHDELCAWASSTLSGWTLWADRPDTAVAAAERGISRAPRHSPIAARLHARAARGYALQGNRAACNARLTEARTLCDRLPDKSPSRLSIESSTLTSCKIAHMAAYCHGRLGDYRQAEKQAREALAVQIYSPGAADIIRIELGIVLANLGVPDEAVEQGKQAFAEPRFLGVLLARARELDTVLMTRYPKEDCVTEFHQQYGQVAGAGVGALVR